MKKIELLAPAGSYESLLAAYKTGADAVYAGGSRFGARAYADNFTEEQFLEAIDYAHFHNKKLYLTLNTLLKSKELQKELYQYVAPLYEQGLDGVIVQDMGVLSFLKSAFPELPIHGSTQMMVTGTDSAMLLKEKGVCRVVPARELSVSELKHMKEICGMELEVFIHGALCYCYSGQCFFSSLLGGRSGNRGRCAQPCRLAYTVDRYTGHVLSPKDLCGLKVIPALYEAGVDSFKIEGRMKSPAYTAGVVSVYRKYLDLFYASPNQYCVEDKDIEQLMDIYNRGGMTDGYFYKHNAGAMISPDRPNHFGLLVGKTTYSTGKQISISLEKDLKKGDVLELRKDQQLVLHELVVSKDYKKGTRFPVFLPKQTRKVKNNKIIRSHTESFPVENGEKLYLYRTKNKDLTKRLEELAKDPLTKEISAGIYLTPECPACLVVSDSRTTVSVEGGLVQRAEKQPLSKDMIFCQLSKTGGTGVVMKDIQCQMDGPVFMPKQELNALRRKGLELFQKEYLSKDRRKAEPSLKEKVMDLLQESAVSATHTTDFTGQYQLTASVETKEQMDTLLSVDEICRLDLDASICPINEHTDKQQLTKLYTDVTESGKQVFHRMPAVFRERTRKRYEQWFPVLASLCHGFVVRNLDAYAYVRKKCRELGIQKTIVCDFTLYSFQPLAADFWKQKDCILTAPIELNFKELLSNAALYQELVVYGRYPLMISAGCVDRTMNYLATGRESCNHRQNMVYLNDRYHKRFPVKQFCNDCYNVIYNSLPLCLCQDKKEIDQLKIPSLRMMFTTESSNDVRQVVKNLTAAFLEGEEIFLPPDSFTRGHFRRGVE